MTELTIASPFLEDGASWFREVRFIWSDNLLSWVGIIEDCMPLFPIRSFEPPIGNKGGLRWLIREDLVAVFGCLRPAEADPGWLINWRLIPGKTKALCPFDVGLWSWSSLKLRVASATRKKVNWILYQFTHASLLNSCLVFNSGLVYWILFLYVPTLRSLIHKRCWLSSKFGGHGKLVGNTFQRYGFHYKNSYNRYK